MAPLHVIFAEMEGKLKTIQYSLQLTLHFHLLNLMCKKIGLIIIIIIIIILINIT